MAEVNNIDLFANIPREITTDVLSRLPIGSIIEAKFVCKEFRDVIESPGFHLSEPQPHLLVIPYTTTSSSTSWHAKFLKLKDDGIVPNTVAIELAVPGYTPLLLSSVNGLILLSENHDDLPLHNLSICNPITREYVTLPNPPPPEYHYSRNSSFGLGVSIRTRQYKVVRIVQLESKEYECQVYTLGTGKWRTIIVGTSPVKSRAVCSFVASLAASME
ncbi:F-box protein At3g07870-like [Salvia hispanica]|uniref:F-box protein At3g07870-like n=1 Tax=Salvia hispanica TaxID=49212 RepID=UPI002008FEFC|nr:F-box protein At3g07870-like [Salvia hispanica]